MRTKAPIYLLAGIIANASGLGLIAILLHNAGMPQELRMSTGIIACTSYLLSAVFLILHAGARRQSTSEARATLLSAIPKHSPENDDWVEKSLEELAEELVAELENLRQGQQAIVNYSKEIICSLDENLKIKEINLSAERILLHQNPALLGAELISLVHEPERERMRKSFQDLREMQEQEKPFECRISDLNSRLIDFSWVVEWSPSKRSYYCIGSNISAEKEIERLRAEITSMVSHDLRAPISSLSFFIQGLIAGEFGQLNDSGRSKVIAIKESLEQMLRLINQLLDAERLEANSLELDLKIVPASAILETSLTLLQQLAEQKKQRITSSQTEELVFADFDRCVQVLNNLLSNAIKFSPESSEIEVKVSSDIDKVKFEISDRGPGIPVQQWSAVFERFKTLGEKKTGESSGLGLYISKRLIELQGGNIGIYSVPGKGSKFWFCLRRAGETDLPGYLD